MGGSRYRSGAGSGPSDTVYLGAFRLGDLRAVGGWDDSMLTNQDYELNRRMSRRGSVWFDARLAVGYIPRQSLADLWRQYERFGRWKVRYWRTTGDSPQTRQLVPLLVVPPVGLAGVAWVLRPTFRRATSLMPLLGAVAVAVAVDALGSTTGDGLRIRMIAVAASVVVAAAWVVGVYREMYEGRPSARDGRVSPSGATR